VLSMALESRTPPDAPFIDLERGIFTGHPCRLGRRTEPEKYRAATVRKRCRVCPSLTVGAQISDFQRSLKCHALQEKKNWSRRDTEAQRSKIEDRIEDRGSNLAIFELRFSILNPRLLETDTTAESADSARSWALCLVAWRSSLHSWCFGGLLFAGNLLLKQKESKSRKSLKVPHPGDTVSPGCSRFPGMRTKPTPDGRLVLSANTYRAVAAIWSQPDKEGDKRLATPCVTCSFPLRSICATIP